MLVAGSTVVGGFQISFEPTTSVIGSPPTQHYCGRVKAVFTITWGRWYYGDMNSLEKEDSVVHNSLSWEFSIPWRGRTIPWGRGFHYYCLQSLEPGDEVKVTLLQGIHVLVPNCLHFGLENFQAVVHQRSKVNRTCIETRIPWRRLPLLCLLIREPGWG